MDLCTARAHYRDWLRNADRSENTVRSAMQALNLVGPNAELAVLGPERLELALGGELAPASYNRYRQVWISFFDWCVQRGYASGNPAKQLPTRRVIEQPNLILTPDQMLGMLDKANPVERIALALGMNTALRAGDVSALRVGDVDLNSLTLRTKIQKTGGFDEKPITKQLALELGQWLGVYRKRALVAHEMDSFSPWGELQNDWFLIPSYVMGPRLEPAGMLGDITVESPRLGVTTLRPASPLTHLHRIVQRALERQGLPTQGEGFHTLRRSAARALFEKLRTEGNYDHALLVVKEFLNHKSVEQTQRYLGINHERQIRDDLLRGKDFLVASAPVCTAGVVDGINQRHGLAYDNPERIY